MTASDEVAQLPGGQDLAALAAQVRGDPGAIRQIASGWAKASGDAAVNTAAVRGAVSEVRRDWKGGSAEAFAALMERFYRAGHRARQAMRAAARALEGAAGSLEEAQRGVEGVCERLLAEVNQLGGTDPPLPRSQLDAKISGLASEAASAARPLVAAAQHALERAAGRLDAGLAELNGSFSALPKSGSQGFAGGWLAASAPALASGPAPSSSAPASAHGILSSLHGSTQAGLTAGGAPAGPGLPAAAGAGPAAPVSAQWGAVGGGSGDATAGSGGTGGPGPGDGAGGTLGSGSLMPPSAGGPAPPAQVDGWIQQAIKILEAQGIPASRLSAQDIWIIIQHESGGNPDAVNLCLPLDAKILTRRGWLKHDEVQIGDETIGYNPVARRSEWTPVTAVHHYADAPLVRIGNARWHAVTTPEHRWVNLPRITEPAPKLPDACPVCPWPDIPPPPLPPATCPECGWVPNRPGGVALHRRRAHGVIGANASGQRIERFRRRGRTTKGGTRIHLAKVHGVKGEGSSNAHAVDMRWVASKDIGSRDRLLLAAPADTGKGLPITLTEAAILGRVARDGHVESGGRTQKGNRLGKGMTISQSKPAMVASLRKLLAGTDHTEYVIKRRGKMKRDGVLFRFTPTYTKDLIGRAGHPKRDAVAQVLDMSAGQRKAWLDAFIDAEGHRDGKHVSVTQVYGPVLEAAHLAIYLCGHRPRLIDCKVTEERWSPCAQISIGRPIVSGAFLEREDAGRGPVWCVTTRLGSWTVEHDGQIFLTGNSDSNAAAGDPSRGLMQCVPLYTRILTSRGWRRHDEVRVGDETLGYDPASGRSEWTPVRKVVHYDDGVVWRIGNRSWHADVTPNHRWWSDTRDARDDGKPPVCPECGYASSPRGVSVHRGRAHRIRSVPAVTYRGEFVRTDGLSPVHRLRLAAPATTHGIAGLTLGEVRIIAWLQAGGDIGRAFAGHGRCPECGWAPRGGRAGRSAGAVAAHCATEHGMTEDRAGGQPAGYDVTICPPAPRQTVKLRALLAGADHIEHVQRPVGTLPVSVFRLHRAHVTDLLKRSRLIETGPEAFVLALSPDQRAAWLDSAADADGCGQPAEAALHDAIELAVYLEGYRPALAGGGTGRGGRRPAGVAGMAAPHVAPSTFGRPRVLDRQPVWCVTTDLQTWTACQDGQIFLTGNTIGSTFDTYALPGHRDIFNPVDNIIAGVRYALARYGSLDDVPGVLAVHNGQPYVGY